MINFTGVGCSSNDKYSQSIVARVGEFSITADDFRISYELFSTNDRSARLADSLKRRSHLQKMINNRLLIIAGRDQRLYEHLSNILSWYEKQAVIRELYRQIVRDKVIVTEDEIRSAYPLSKQRLDLRQLLYSSKDKASEAYRRLQNGESFETLAAESARSDTELVYILTPREFNWGEIDDRMWSAVYNLDALAVSAPIKIDRLYHIVQLVNRKESLLLTESSFQERSDNIRSIIRRGKEQRLAEEYAGTLLSDKRLDVDSRVLLELVEYMCSSNYAFADFGLTSLLTSGITEQKRDSLLDKKLIYYSGDIWTVKDFLDYVYSMPNTEKPNLLDPEQLKIDIALIIRDEFLSEEGYRRNLQTSPAVKQERGQIREELLAFQVCQALLDTVKIEDNEIAQYITGDSNWENEKQRQYALAKKKQTILQQYLYELRKQHSVEIYDEILQSIKTSDEMSAGHPITIKNIRRF